MEAESNTQIEILNYFLKLLMIPFHFRSNIWNKSLLSHFLVSSNQRHFVVVLNRSSLTCCVINLLSPALIQRCSFPFSFLIHNSCPQGLMIHFRLGIDFWISYAVLTETSNSFLKPSRQLFSHFVSFNQSTDSDTLGKYYIQIDSF